MRFGARDAATRPAALRRAAPRGVLLAALWWVLTGGDAGSWLIGLLAVVCATVASLALSPAGDWRWSGVGVLRFVPYFLWQSLVGSVDVALRALCPGLPLQPSLLDYELRLPEDSARVFMANAVSLLPGTLSAELDGRRLLVHTLTQSPGISENLRALELRVAGLFGLQTPSEGDGEEHQGG